MPELLTTAEFEQRVVKVSERLDALRGSSRFGSGGATGLPYLGIDLSSELQELKPILSTLIHQDPDEPITTNARLEVGGRRLALAAIAGLLLQGDGMADFPARYKALMDVEPEYELFERILPAAMREAGLPLPTKPEPKRLLETLLVVAGIPKALLQAVAEYFVVYWTKFHPQLDVLAPLHAVEANTELAGLDAPTRKALSVLSKRLVPNAGVAGPVVAHLADIMLGLRAQPKWRVTDLFAQAETIRGWTGCDPKKLLQGDEEALAILIAGLDKGWHPDQFRHVMMSFPRGGEVRLPSGSLAMVDKAIAVPQWGLYRIESKTYMVTPNEGLTIEDLEAFPEAGLDAYGTRIVWRGPAEPKMTSDGWPDVMLSRQVFVDKVAKGWLFLDVGPTARTFGIGDIQIQPRPGVHWGASIYTSIDGEGKPAINVRILGLRVCLPSLAGRTLQLECPQAETAGRLTFELDERGVGGLPDRVLPLTAPGTGAVELVLQDHEDSETAKLDGRPLHHKIPLADIMLAAEATGDLVPPSEEVRPYGLPVYLMFATRPVNTSVLQSRDIGVDPLGKTGDYEVHRLRWTEPLQALEVYVDGRHQWNFAYRVDAVWQAGELPAPPPPFTFAPETPHGFTVSSADQLYVDEVSLVENPLVTVMRDGQALFTHTWPELNWLMNFPIENRRLSGVMLHRALHAGVDFDLAGVYILRLTAGGELLGERSLTILPQMVVKSSPTGLVDEDATYKVVATCNLPCFAHGSKRQEVTLGSPIVDRDAMENSPFAPRPLEGKLTLYFPRLEVPIAVTPDVGGFRLLDDNEGTWVRKTNLTFEELDHITLVLFAAHGRQGTLKVGDDEAIQEEFYEGFATFSLASIIPTLKSSETDVQVAIDGRDFGTLNVAWHPTVSRFEAASEYLLESVAQVELAAKGPADISLRLEAYSPEGKKLATQEVETDGNIDRVVSMAIPGGKDHPIITIKVFVPTLQSGLASGTVEIRNAAFEPEIEALNIRITAEPRSAELRFERAQLLVGKGLRKAAARDFQAAIDFGMTELTDSPQYQQFLTQRRAEGFHEDLKALASFFVPFARKELTIG